MLIARRMDAVLPSLWSPILTDLLGTRADASPSFLPNMDLLEDEKGFEITLALPGIPKEALKVEVKDRLLTVSGERNLNRTEDKKYHRVENLYGAFSRSFRLPENLKADAIEANYADGVLKLWLPKDEQKQLSLTVAVK